MQIAQYGFRHDLVDIFCLSLFYMCKKYGAHVHRNFLAIICQSVISKVCERIQSRTLSYFDSPLATDKPR